MCMCNYRRFHNKTFLRFDMYHLHNAVIDSELKNVDMQFLNRQFTFGLGFTFCCNSSQIFFLLRIESRHTASSLIIITFLRVILSFINVSGQHLKNHSWLALDLDHWCRHTTTFVDPNWNPGLINEGG